MSSDAPDTPAAAGTNVSPRASADSGSHAFDAEQAGFQQGLGSRQMQMIAIGSSVGTGLFLGTGGRLQSAGPSLFLLYAACGFFGYLIMRALGELIVYRPSSGSFVSYTREFYGEGAAYVSGWLYWFNWAMTAVADATALAIYILWFGKFGALAFISSIPQWTIALLAVILVSSVNLLAVRVFGELEYWFSLVKVLALVLFLIVGTALVIIGSARGEATGFRLITDHGGLFPNGAITSIIAMQGVVFAYAGIELVGTTAGETRDARKVIPRAVNTVILRIAVFYCGSVLLLCLLLPYTAYSATESPFVTFFSSIGIDAAGPIMQLVVITAAISSMNAGMYSTGRILHSMSLAGSAPRFAQRMSASGVPYGGIALTTIVAVVGVGLNYWVPQQAFEIVLNVAAIGTMVSWGAIALSHQRFLNLARQGARTRPDYRAPGGRFADWAILAFIAAATVLIAFDYPVGTWTLATVLLLGPALWVGWLFARNQVQQINLARDGGDGAAVIGGLPELDVVQAGHTRAPGTPNGQCTHRDTSDPEPR